MVNNVYFLQRSIPLIGIFFAMAVDQLSSTVCCMKLNFIKFQLHLGFATGETGIEI